MIHTVDDRAVPFELPIGPDYGPKVIIAEVLTVIERFYELNAPISLCAR